MSHTPWRPLITLRQYATLINIKAYICTMQVPADYPLATRLYLNFITKFASTEVHGYMGNTCGSATP